MSNPLHVGVIGLGRRWEKRYRAGLLALRDRIRVGALYDQCQARARAEADLLSCGTSDGPTVLLARDDVEAVLLPDWQWFGLWPIDLACRFGKPVLCGVPLQLDDAHADCLHQRVMEHRLPVMMETLPGLPQLSLRLRDLLATCLGPPRLVLCQGISPLAKEEKESDLGPLHADGCHVLPILDWCAWMLQGQPESILAGGAANGEFTSILLHLDNGRVAQIHHHRAPGASRRLDVEIVAERGSVRLSLPNRIRWIDPEGRHTHTLPKDQPHTVKMLVEFYQVIKEGLDPPWNLPGAFRALQWLRAAQRSRAEGCRVNLRT